MRNLFLIGWLTATWVLHSCSFAQNSNTQNFTRLSAAEFAEKIQQTPAAVVVDVRTPAEFAKGHLPQALNIDWKGSEFDKQMATLDKAAPVFIYCLSGGRSASAAHKLSAAGFQNIYELEGGITQWRAAELPERTE